MNIFTDDLSGIIRRLKARSRAHKRAPVPLDTAGERGEAVARLRTCALFKDVPEEKLLDMIPHMELFRRGAGDVILREGEEGDFYYLLLEGTAGVTRKAGRDGKPEQLATLEPGAAFGEEALISMSTRNATVTMEADGLLVRMPRGAFVDHIQDLLVTWLSAAECNRRVSAGARWVDVREAREMQKEHLREAISLPLAELRERLPELDQAVFYICYDERGRRSATAAFLMRQRGFNVAVLQGGLRGLRH
ncbi:MAG: cyclic nucleotide-binding domain-containing protein [Kiritimatiellae bacterium]|nr:cyclic nucleotide-binding domain-containing protein [Kiritimatiellia bacterium]